MDDNAVRQVAERQREGLAHERGSAWRPDDVHGFGLRLAFRWQRALLPERAQQARKSKGVVPVQVGDEDEIHPAELQRGAQELVLRVLRAEVGALARA